MAIEVLIPWLGGDPRREAAWRWVQERFAPYPWPLIRCAGSTPWVKADALMPVVRSSSADVVVVSDADVWCPGLPDAVSAVQEGAAWAVPHTKVHRLMLAATDLVLGGADPDGQDTEEEPYGGLPGGGIVVLRRETLLEVPLDPRFIGWGGEDRAWGLALRCLLGKPRRGRYPLFHLWHPPQLRRTRAHGSERNQDLARRYTAARHSPTEMRELLDEIGDFDGATQADQDQEGEPRQAA